MEIFWRIFKNEILEQNNLPWAKRVIYEYLSNNSFLLILVKNLEILDFIVTFCLGLFSWLALSQNNKIGFKYIFGSKILFKSKRQKI